MSNESKALAIIPKTVEEVRSLAAMFAKSSLLPPDLRGKEADVFVSIMAGQELGLPPMAALRGVHVVKGKPVLSADSMVGIVLGSGLAEYFSCVEETTEAVTYETKRRGSPHPQRCTWAIEDAKRAGLDGDNWRRYPRAMLKARCKAMLARDVYPDVLAGCYDEDEARDFGPIRSSEPDPNIQDAEIVSEAPAEPKSSNGHTEDATIAAIDGATSVDVLRGMVPSLQKLKGPLRDKAREKYEAKMQQLQAGVA